MPVLKINTYGHENDTHLPTCFLGSTDDITIASTRVYECEDKLSGIVHDYMGDAKLTPVDNYNEVKMDPSLAGYANKHGLTINRVLELLDPSSGYASTDVMGKYSALERQCIRFGLMRKKKSFYGPEDSVPLSYAVSNTPANAVLFPAMMKAGFFWEPLVDQDLDPNMLFAGTRVQKEKQYQQVIMNDSQFRHRRLNIISEMGDVPTSRLTMEGYNGSMIQHGTGFTYTRDFAEQASLNFFNIAFNRSKIREGRAYFDHVLDTIINGYAQYGLDTGASSTRAQTLDPTGITGNGEISYLALSLFLYAMRPYKPTLAIVNVNTYHSFIQATAPKNVLENSILQVLAQAQYPGMPKATNPEFLGQTPPAFVVPADVLADNLILFMDTRNAIERVVMAGGEHSDLGYDFKHRVFNQIFLINDGIGILPAFDDATQILDLSVL